MGSKICLGGVLCFALGPLQLLFFFELKDLHRA